MTPESGDDVPSCCVRGTEVPTRPWGVLKDAASFRTRCRRVGTSVPHNQTIHECIASTVPLTSVRSRVSRSAASPRSEEHTSELQSPCNLVCRLLLEKKKKNIITNIRLPLHTALIPGLRACDSEP